MSKCDLFDPINPKRRINCGNCNNWNGMKRPLIEAIIRSRKDIEAGKTVPLESLRR